MLKIGYDVMADLRSIWFMKLHLKLKPSNNHFTGIAHLWKFLEILAKCFKNHPKLCEFAKAAQVIAIRFILPSGINGRRNLKVFNFTKYFTLIVKTEYLFIISTIASMFAYKEIEGDIINIELFESIKVRKSQLNQSAVKKIIRLTRLFYLIKSLETVFDFDTEILDRNFKNQRTFKYL